LNIVEALLLLMALCVIFLIGLILHSIVTWLLTEADRRGVEPQFGYALVCKHEYRPSYVSLIPAGKALIPVRHPETFFLMVQVRGRSKPEQIEVIKSAYEGIADNTWIGVTYQVGKNSGKIYINDLAGRVR
jgi:hypothetical protein